MSFGIITSEGKETDYKTVYTLKVETINGDKKYKNTNLNLYVEKGENLEYGKKISFIRRIYKANTCYKL